LKPESITAILGRSCMQDKLLPLPRIDGLDVAMRVTWCSGETSEPEAASTTASVRGYQFLVEGIPFDTGSVTSDYRIILGSREHLGQMRATYAEAVVDAWMFAKQHVEDLARRERIAAEAHAEVIRKDCDQNEVERDDLARRYGLAAGQRDRLAIERDACKKKLSALASVSDWKSAKITELESTLAKRPIVFGYEPRVPEQAQIDDHEARLRVLESAKRDA